MAKPNSRLNDIKQKAIHAYRQQDLVEARRSFEKVVKQNRSDAESWLFLGNVYGRLAKYAKAEQAFRQVISLSPGSAGAYNNLGLALESQDKIAAAFEAFQQALTVDPGNADTHYNLANSLVTLGRLDEAVKHYEQVLKAQPENYAALINLGYVLERQGLYTGAVQIFSKAIAACPYSAEAHYNLGNVLKTQGDLADATEKYQQAIKLNPEYDEAWNNLGNVLLAQGLVTGAIAIYQQILDRHPGKAKYYSSIIFANNYLAELSQHQLFEQHLEYDKRFAAEPSQLDSQYSKRCDAERKLRIAYVSADLHDHSVAYFFEPLLRHHNKEMFETFCYSNGSKCDAVTERLQKYCQHWREITGLLDKQVIAKIRADKIDILIDLAGHTANNRLPVFAHKPAPVQITWLGYPNTTGMAAMDYRITDNKADPDGQETYHTEALYRLENGFLCYRPADNCPEVAELPSINTGHITFGSFNNFAKTTEAVIELWARLLKAIPQSRLLLKNGALREKKVCQRVIDVFRQHGLEEDRLELIGWLPDKSDHIKLYEKIDIGLDTFPYNGTTTTCEAIWMGVPVITLCGERHAARVGNSLLHQVGLQELIAHTEDEYVEIAKALANDTDRLRALREGMRKRIQSSPLCDEEGFTRQLEQAYRDMWVKWCEQQKR